MIRIGLIINPIAGMGGRVGLKGTDGADILAEALALGARPESAAKTALALKELKPVSGSILVLTCPGFMGEDLVRECGFNCEVVEINHFNKGDLFSTSPDHTIKAVKEMVRQGIELLLFAGGDGTARDICMALGENIKLPVIGIPAGVKIHSAAYAVNPRSAGRLALSYLQQEGLSLKDAEVIDLDEGAYREGRVLPKLYGYLSVPVDENLMQHLKVGRSNSPAENLEAIATSVIETMETDNIYVIGPGSTTASIMDKLGLPGTLLGVDLVENGNLIIKDAGEQDILETIENKLAKIVITVIGGQGYLFGRGNQQISAAVIRKIGRDNIIICAEREKILSLENRSLLVDTGDQEVNRMLSGYYRVVTGYRESIVYPVSQVF